MEEQKISYIWTHSKTWSPLCSHIKTCWKKPESAVHLSRRAKKSYDRSWSLLLTSLYIIPLIKTTTCQQEINPSSVNFVFMSNNRNKTGSSKTYCSDEIGTITYVFWHCLENICHISDQRRDTHIRNLSNCPVREKRPMADAIGAVDCFSSAFSIISIPAWSYFKQKRMISINLMLCLNLLLPAGYKGQSNYL